MTTAATLAANKTVGIAFSLCFEGLPYVFCTGTADTMSTAFSGVTDFEDADFYAGLHILGSMGGKVSPWDPTIDPDSLDFTITEQIPSNSPITTTAGILASTFLKAGHAQTTRTFLETSVDCNDTTFDIQDQSVMTAATATAYIGNETISYTGKVNNAPPTADQLTGVTRGKFALHQTNTPAAFSPAHQINTDYGTGLKPQITNSPRSEHYGRQVMLRAHSIDPLTGAYDTVANALILWVGRINSYRWNGDGTMTFTCDHVIGMLKDGQIFSNQFRAEVAPGQFVPVGASRVRFREYTTAAGNNIQYATMLGAGAQKTAHEMRALVTLAANTLKVATSLAYDFDVYQADIRVTNAGAVITADARVFVALSWEVWSLLGWDNDGVEFIDDSTGTPYRLLEKEITRYNTTECRLLRDFEAVAYNFTLDQGAVTTLENARGTWVNQPALPSLIPVLPATTEGFLQIGGYGVCAVTYDSATQVTSTGDYSNEFASKGIGSDELLGRVIIRSDVAQQPIPVKQIWWESGNAAAILLKFLLSTGTTNFNHATYDRLPFGMGLGVPASLLNIPSFQSLADLQASFLLTGPTKFVDYFESQLAVAGKYCVWQDGKIALRPMALVSPNITPAITFTEGNKASDDVMASQRLQVDYSSDGVINRCVLEYNRLVDGTFRDKLAIEDVVSVTDFGRRKTLSVKGWSVGNIGEAESWIDNVAASVLAFFSRPFARARRTFTYQEIGNGIACGDTVLLTDSGMIDPATGLHGVTNMPGCIVGWEYDWTTGVGVAEIILLPEYDATRLAAWAPTARIASYVAATKVITCVAHQYSHSSEATDATRFPAGSKVRLVSYSPANPAAPTNYQAEVASQTGDTVTLTADPTAGAGLSGTFNLQFDEILTAVAAQDANSFVADDATDSTGDAAGDSYKFGSDVDNPSTITFGSLDYAQRFTRIADIADNAAEPYSVGDYHDAVKSLNCLLGRVTNTAPISEYFETAPTQTGTTYRLVYQMWLPCMGVDRSLIVAMRGYHSVGTSSASFRVTLALQMPDGTALTAATWAGATVTDTTTVSATAVKAMAEITLAPAPATLGGFHPPGMWLSVEIKAGAVGETATLVGIDVREARL